MLRGQGSPIWRVETCQNCNSDDRCERSHTRFTVRDHLTSRVPYMEAIVPLRILGHWPVRMALKAVFRHHSD